MINIDYNSKGAAKNMKMEDNVLQVSVDDIIPNRFQPRLAFDEQGLNELAESIRQHGIIQPLVLRKIGDKYEIIAGERRYKASYIAGLTKVPAVIIDLNDNESAEVAIVENIQRKDLSPIEEAKSYKKLLDRGYLTQDQLASRMGKNQSTVSNKLRLLNSILYSFSIVSKIALYNATEIPLFNLIFKKSLYLTKNSSISVSVINSTESLLNTLIPLLSG